ncbi:MAG: endonuclease [Anaerolineae bacterium]|nr:endonuclease [Anaerolineae bacterium]
MLYLLRFSGVLGNPGNPHGAAQYYLGWCDDRPGALEARLAEHRRGQGAAITRAAIERGYGIELVATHPGNRDAEKRFKRWKNHRQVLTAWQKGGR